MWYEFFKVFSYAFANDPLSQKYIKDLNGAGVTQPDAMPSLRANQDSLSGGRGSIRLRDSNDLVDLSSITNRMQRYKEYERLLGMAEISNAMTTFADEACVSGDTKVATPHGFYEIRTLAISQKTERFLVYCYDFEKNDYTLGWAFNPRLTKKAKTIRIILDDQNVFICTPDHRILMRDATWKYAEDIKFGDELMPFYRIPANHSLTQLKTNQFPRIWTHHRGWIHERQFANEWSTGVRSPKLEIINQYTRLITDKMTFANLQKLTGSENRTIRSRLKKHGFSIEELKWLNRKQEFRRVVSVQSYNEMEVFDLSVEKHHNFATNWGIVHNCQKDDDGRAMQIICENKQIKKELEYLLFHRKMLNLDQKKMWNKAFGLFSMGDYFEEVIIDIENPKAGVIGINALPQDSMYRIETTKGKLIEFQQSKDGPDYQSLERIDVTQATDEDLQQATAIRFAPEQIIHTKIGDERKTFYPYGISLIEPARSPAHQLKLMEDSMLVYRLSRAPERRAFYIDVENYAPAKAEAFMERMKDQFKKKKVPSNRGLSGASSVEERWHSPAVDEDIWIPIRKNSNTRIETLPGASNLGEVDDTVYFKSKLYTALNFPKIQINSEDPQVTRMNLSNLDSKFAKLIERLQSHIEEGLWQICDIHLRLRGFPEESYEDLVIKMTVPSDYRELARMEVLQGRLNAASTIKGSGLLSDFDILTSYLKLPEEQAKEMIARNKIQKLEELKLAILAQNPILLGVGTPGPDDQEIGIDANGPSPMLGADQNPPPIDQNPPAQPGQEPAQNQPNMKKFMDGDTGNTLPIPNEDDINKYNLDIRSYESDIDVEEIDFSEA